MACAWQGRTGAGTCIERLFSILNMRIAKDDLRAAAVIRETAMQLLAEGISPGLVIHRYGSKEGRKGTVNRRAVAFLGEMIGELGRLGQESGSASLVELIAGRLESEPAMADYI